jgi:RNase P protein component
VVRNRLRRRCRAALRDLERAGLLASGWYLIGATPAAVELTFDQLAETLALLAGGAREMAAQVQARPEGESSAVVMAGA